MTRTRMAATLTICLMLASAAAIRADVRADEKTKFQLAGALGKIVNIFGGKNARDGVTTTQAVKGTRKISFNDTTGQIIDLSEEKVYDLDMKKKSYKVTTFAELRQRMEAAQAKAEADAKKEQASAPSAEPARDPNQKDLEVDFDIKSTGQSKTINGFDTHETVVTITVREKGKTLEEGGGLVLTSDMWLAPTIASMKELAEFDLKYYQKLYGGVMLGASPEDMAQAVALYPMVKPALAKLSANGDKITGTAILTTLTTDSVKSADEMAQEQQAQSSQSSSSSSGSSGGSIGGRLLGSLASKAVKKDEPQARTTFMTTTNEVLKVTNDVGANDVAIPAGFKENK